MCLSHLCIRAFDISGPVIYAPMMSGPLVCLSHWFVSATGVSGPLVCLGHGVKGHLD